MSRRHWSEELVIEKWNIFQKLRNEYDIPFEIARSRIGIDTSGSWTWFRRRVKKILGKRGESLEYGKPDDNSV